MKKAIALVALALIASSFLFCSPVYVVRAGIEEAKILSRRRAIEAVVADPSTPEPTRAKLRLVLQARTFAAQHLGLDVGDSYTTYSRVDGDTLLMMVSGARKDAFVPYTWWFPIVGRVPYKGFFDFDDAYAEATSLEEKGYDAYVRPSGAFSTLGWFNDPLLSTILDYADVSLAGTVIHEVTHNTIYLAGQAAFNESFANFVGDRGAAEYFCLLEGDDGERCRRARDLWHDNLVFGTFLQELVDSLQAVYGDDALDYDAKLAAREEVFAAAKERYRRDVVPELRVAFRGYMDRPLNNATLIGTRLYYRDLHLFEAVYQRYGSLPAAIDAIIEVAESRPDDPFEGLAELAAGAVVREPAS